MFFFKKHQCKIAAPLSHTWFFVCSTAVHCINLCALTHAAHPKKSDGVMQEH